MSSVLVTGSNKGIGLATALVLDRAGHKVYATMRNLERRDRAIGKEKLPIEVHAMDIDTDSSIAAAIAAIHSHAGFIKRPAMPTVVGEAIRGIGGGTYHPFGPDSKPFLEWRVRYRTNSGSNGARSTTKRGRCV